MTKYYTHELLQDPPILIFTVSENYDVTASHVESTQETLNMLDQQTEPVIYIANLAKLKFGFDELLASASRAARGTRSPYHHPMMKMVILVSQDDELIAMYRGLDTPAFGNVKVHIFPTIDEALAFARATV